MAIVGERITVTNSPTLLVQGTDRIDLARPVVVKNIDATNGVDLGGATVTVGGGYLLSAGSTIDGTFMKNDDLYGVAAGSVVVCVLRGRS